MESHVVKEGGTGTTEVFLDGYADVQAYITSILRSVVATSKTTNALPAAGNDFDFYSSFQGFQDAMRLEGGRLLDVMTHMMKHQGSHNCRLGRNETANDVEEKTEAVIDANDLMLERVNNLLDEASGKKKTDATLIVASLKEAGEVPAAGVATWNRETAGFGSKRDKSAQLRDLKLLAAKNVQRPQLSFKDTIDNSPSPFVCKLRHKPHSKTAFHGFQSSDLAGDDVLHPYQHEIRSLTYAEYQVEPHPEPLIFPESLDDTPFTFVNTVAGLVTLCQALEAVDEFAVDLEAHSFRSFQGLTCLMQISTHDRDFVVDVLVPEVRWEMQMLNRVFADARIVKVFHGADWDVKWLQRDFGVYVVNMFDTFQASRILETARHSLAFLLHHYCAVDTNKKYQMADWRMRPLPEELMAYARTDTHFLLFIKAKMKNQLIEKGNQQKNLLMATLNQSAQVASQVYSKAEFDPQGYKNMLLNHKKSFNSQQLAALESLYAWRDALARQEDESVGFVLPNHMMISIAEVLPREPNGILACCNPLPPLVKQQLNEIHRLLMDAKDVTFIRQSLQHPVQKAYASNPKYNSEKLLKCPLDTTHAAADAEMQEPEWPSSSSRGPPPEVASLPRPRLDLGQFQASSLTSSMLMGGATASMVSPSASASAKAAAIHSTILSPFHIFLPVEVTAKTLPSATVPPKWRIRIVKKASKIMDIQKAAKAELERKRLHGEDEEETAKKRKAEKVERKKVIPLSALKEMEEEEEKKKGKNAKRNKKKKTELKKGAAIDMAEINEAKAKIFREAKPETQVLGTRDGQVVVVREGEATGGQEGEPSGGQEGEASGGQKEKKRKKKKKAAAETSDNNTEKTEICPFDYSKSDMKKFSKGLDKKKAAERQVDPNADLLKKKGKKKGSKKMGQQHYGGKDSFTQKPGSSSGKR